jgi:hypothetical protein
MPGETLRKQKPRHRCRVHSSVIPGREQGERARNPLIRWLGRNLWVEINPLLIVFFEHTMNTWRNGFRARAKRRVPE